MFFYPGGYNFFLNYFSALGRTTTAADHSLPNTPNPISSVMFTTTIIITGIALVFFWIGIVNLFSEKKITKILSLSGTAIGLISSPFLIGVGIFPGDLFPGPTGLHTISASVFFLLFAIAIILYSIAIFFKEDYPNGYAIIGLIFASLVILYVIDIFALIAPLAQKIIVYSFISWSLLQASKAWKIIEN